MKNKEELIKKANELGFKLGSIIETSADGVIYNLPIEGYKLHFTDSKVEVLSIYKYDELENTLLVAVFLNELIKYDDGCSSRVLLIPIYKDGKWATLK